MFKPVKVFAFLALTLVLLISISLLLPPDGLKLHHYTLKYPRPEVLLGLQSSGHPTDYTLDRGIIELGSMLDSLAEHLALADTLPLQQIPVDSLAMDTLHLMEQEYSVPNPNKLTAEILRDRLVQIEIPDSSFAALHAFFRALKSGEVSRKQVRVMHYGDSQIEGDRITSFLRSRLQTRFGGGGVGLLNAVPHSYQPVGVHQVNSNNWHYTSIADLGKGAVAHRFGLTGGYSVFQKNEKAPGGFAEAWIDLERRGSHSSLARNYTQCRVIYGSVSEPIMLSVSYEGSTQEAEFLSPTRTIESVGWSIPKSANRVRLTFRGDESPMVYAISLETSKGIVVDNLPIRGSSGVDFTRADDTSLKRVMELMDPRLIILQFGVNIVPHIVDSYAYYEMQLYQQIIALKKACPNASLILIGVSDMSRKVDGRFVSYPNIEAIRDAQRSAALRAGAAFWDCYQAMGGQNSMPAWVYASPALATKDFIHFTPRGSKILAEMFYSALMALYDEYGKERNG